MALTRLQVADLLEEIALGATFFTQLAYHSEGLQLWLQHNPAAKKRVTIFEKGYLEHLNQLSEEDKTNFQILLAQHFRVAVNTENHLDKLKDGNNKKSLINLLKRCESLAKYLRENITPLRPLFVKWAKIADTYNSYVVAQFEIISLQHKLEQKLHLTKNKQYSVLEMIDVVLDYLNLQRQALFFHVTLFAGEAARLAEGVKRFNILIDILISFDRYCECFADISQFENHQIEDSEAAIDKLAWFVNQMEKQTEEAMQNVNAELFVRALYRYIIDNNWDCRANEQKAKIIYSAKQSYYFQLQKKEVPSIVAKQFELCRRAMGSEISFTEAKASIEKLVTKVNQKRQLVKFSESTLAYFNLFEPNISALEEKAKITKLELSEANIFKKYRRP